MTTASLLARVKARFDDPDQAIYDDASWVAYLNDAYKWVASSSPYWPFEETRATVSVTAGANAGDLPTGCTQVNLVWDQTNGIVLTPFGNRKQHAQYLPYATEQGTAWWYRLFNDTLEVYPAPAATTSYTIEYFGPLATLVAGSVDPAIPEVHQGVISEYALYLAYKDDDDDGNAQAHKAEAVELLTRLATDLTANRTDSFQDVVDDAYA